MLPLNADSGFGVRTHEAAAVINSSSSKGLQLLLQELHLGRNRAQA